MVRFKPEAYGEPFPRDGIIPKSEVTKIEKCVEVYRTLYPEGNSDIIRELLCILYRSKKIELR